jgi:hypothetical protein
MSCKPDSTGADWFVCYHGTTGCPICHDGMTPYCRDCAAGNCNGPHEPLPASITVEEFCERHPEQRRLLLGHP